MRDNIFFDTNILIYAHDSSDKDKQRRAQELIFRGLAEKNMVVSTQIFSEYFVVATKKLDLSYTDVIRELHLLSKARVVEITLNMVFESIQTQGNNRISFWDALIVVTASLSQCSLLYTEDLSSGQIIQGVRIINPFLS